MYKAIGFDLGGVIIESAPPKIYQAMAERFQVEEAVLRKAMDQYLPSYDRGEVSAEQFWKNVTAALGVKFDIAMDEQLWNEKYVSSSPIRTEVLDLVERLKTNGYKVGMLSNIDSEHGHLNMDRGIFDHFPVVLLSYQIHARKPEPKAFEALAEALGVVPKELIFIDDLEVNVHGAEKVGMKGLQYNSFETLVADLRNLDINTD